MDDANFEHGTANGAILRLTKELAWIGAPCRCRCFVNHPSMHLPGPAAAPCPVNGLTWSQCRCCLAVLPGSVKAPVGLPPPVHARASQGSTARVMECLSLSKL